MPNVKCLELGDILRRIEGSEPATVELPSGPSVLLSFLSSSSTSFLLSLLSSDGVTGLVAASSKARPHARRFTTSAILCTKSNNKKKREQEEKKKDLRPTWSPMTLRWLLLAFHFNLQPLAAVADPKLLQFSHCSF